MGDTDEAVEASALLARIHRDPNILVGKPVIRGSRISVEMILENLAAGLTEDQLMYSFKIEREDVRACLAYAADRMRQIDRRAA